MNVKHTPMAFICLIILIMVCIIGCTPKKNEQHIITTTPTTTIMTPTEPTGFVPSPHRHNYEVISHEVDDIGAFRTEQCTECGNIRYIPE